MAGKKSKENGGETFGKGRDVSELERLANRMANAAARGETQGDDVQRAVAKGLAPEELEQVATRMVEATRQAPRFRPDSRGLTTIRPVKMTPGFHRPSDGSVLYQAGNTVVLCSASIDDRVPAFLEGKNRGWVTAEYQMHPRASAHRRQDREGRGSKGLGGRTQEIQRLIGRSLRAAVDLEALGPRTITIDCDVLEADGGTRTASITGGFVAMAFALEKLMFRGVLDKPCIRDRVAAISVGYVDGRMLADLVYVEDSTAEFDLNVVGTGSGEIVEVQGTAEGRPLPRKLFDDMVNLAMTEVATLCRLQNTTLGMGGAPLPSLMVPR